MKALASKLFIFALIASPAFGMTTLRPLIEVTTYGGMPMPTVRGPHGVRILSNGVIQTVDGEATTEVGKLTLQEVQTIANVVENMEGELQDLNQGQPMCADAPVTDYIVTRSDLRPLVITKLANCHKLQLNGEESYRTYNIVSLLDGLAALSRLK